MKAINRTIIFLLALLLSISIAHSQHKEVWQIDVNQYQKMPASLKLKSEKSAGMVLLDVTGQKIAFGGSDKKLSVHDVQSGTMLWQKSGAEFEVNSGANLWTLNVPLFAVANNMFAGGKIFFYNWSDGSQVGNMQPYARGKHGMAFAQQSSLVWFGPDHNIFGYSVTGSKFITSTSGAAGHTSDGGSLRFGPYENLYSVAPDKKFIKWENKLNEQDNLITYTGAHEVLFEADYPLMSLALNPYIQGSKVAQSGTIYAAIGENRGLVRIFHLNGQKDPIATFQISDGYCGNLAFHTTDPDVLIATGKKSVIFYDIVEKKVLRTIEQPAEVRGFDLSMDGAKWTVGLSDGDVRVYSLGKTLMDLRPGEKAKITSLDGGGATGGLFKFAQLEVGQTITLKEITENEKGLKFKCDSDNDTMTSFSIYLPQAKRVYVDQIID